MVSNYQGEFSFQSIYPGLYAPRPSIHFKLSAVGYQTVITQTYFKNDASNHSERIEQRIDPCRIIEFDLDNNNRMIGKMDFYLQPVKK